MAYVVDRVVICDAFREPDQHYQLLPGGKSKLVKERRPSMRFLVSARDVAGGISGVVGREAGLFEDMLASSEQRNDFVNQLRIDNDALPKGDRPWLGICLGIIDGDLDFEVAKVRAADLLADLRSLS